MPPLYIPSGDATYWAALSAYATGCGALATFLAVLAALVVALYPDHIKPRLLGPKLRFVDKHHSPFPLKAETNGEPPIWFPTTKYRLAVINEGRSSAHAVTARLERVEANDSNVNLIDVPLVLFWSTAARQREHADDRQYNLPAVRYDRPIDVSPNQTVLLDVIYHVTADSTGGEIGFRVAAGHGAEGTRLKWLRTSSQFRLHVALYSENAQTERATFSLDLEAGTEILALDDH